MAYIEETYIQDDDNNSFTDEMQSARSTIDENPPKILNSKKSIYTTSTQTNNLTICQNCTHIADIIESDDYQNFIHWQTEQFFMLKKDDFHELLEKFSAIKESLQQREQNYENVLKLKWSNQKCEERIFELNNRAQHKEKCMKKIIYKLTMNSANNNNGENITVKEKNLINCIVDECELKKLQKK